MSQPLRIKQKEQVTVILPDGTKVVVFGDGLITTSNGRIIQA